jgi:hypothetical protein
MTVLNRVQIRTKALLSGAKCRGLSGPRFLFWGKRGEEKMKKRKNLGCLIKGKKERGAWAELYFMVLAMSQG